ncbi:MAG: gamma-glutamyltransferase [Proteobacteria bacterium]|nr:gamma-glutamyltransferase [Pseudomonadota bacterium]MDA0951716.1 gamma-glutamyltransferase [Pseudomonadota bacterium]
MPSFENVTEHWNLCKPAVAGRKGIVATNHYEVSEIGADVLRRGGNAVDAAVAVSFAIGVVEPWNSGLGGCGFMQVFDAARRKVTSIDFGTVSPRGIEVGDYPLAGGTAEGGFNWPAVIGDRNIVGPLSVGVPTLVAGMARALETFGTRSWASSLEGAIALAERGMLIDWYASLLLASEAAEMARFPDLAALYMPGGHTPAAGWSGPLPRLDLGPLAATLQHLAEAGPGDFYHGVLADRIDADARRIHCPLRKVDLESFEARVCEPSVGQYRGATVHSAPGLSAGPSLLHALELLEAHTLAPAPDAATYMAYAESLFEAYRVRLATMGEVARAPSSTTTFSVVDGDGNMAIVTQTLMSGFGSKIRLPQTGVILNNGMLWFDPVPGQPNAIAPGKRPLSNMAPTVVLREDRADFGLGALGGRHIFPAIFQLISFIHDFGMDPGEAMAQPRIDVSGGEEVTVDARLKGPVLNALGAGHPVAVEQNGVLPEAFACANIVMQDKSGGQSAAVHIPMPWALAVAV